MTANAHGAAAAVIDSPVGPLSIAVDGEGSLTRISFEPADALRIAPSNAALQRVADQLDQYFRGERLNFDLVLAPRGTAFQQRVWAALQRIPFGTTWSYADLAQEVGQPKATRAVGQANGRNPVPIVIPCHRVIARDGTIGGYSAGGLRKDFLLALEGCPPRMKRGAEAPRLTGWLFS